MPDPVAMLKEDHQKVKQLFQEFESADSSRKMQICKQALMELDVHAKIEEEIFYPAMNQALHDEMLMAEAEEEHHVAKTIMSELKACTTPDVHFEAKFTVLAENVKHHIEEEESQMLTKARSMGQDQLDQLGMRMQMRKQELMSQMQAGAPAF